MQAELVADIARQLGVDRVLSPAGALPQPATRLDASGPVRPREFEVAVERLCLDSTSFRNIKDAVGANPGLMAERIMGIVESRGKMHNPETDSGGVLLGTVSAVGDDFGLPPLPGSRVVTLASLTLTPLRLERIVRLDPDSPQIEVEGHAYVCERAPWSELPDDLPAARTLEALDVYAAASHTHTLAPSSGCVCVLGAGHAGKLALAAANDALEHGTVVAVDVDERAVEAALDHGLCDIGVSADLRDPLAVLEAMRRAGAPVADLTVVVVNATGCEPSAVLATAPGGTVLFFSMATSFQTAALTADGMSSDITMLIGSGFAPDRGSYALDLLRSRPNLREALGTSPGESG